MNFTKPCRLTERNKIYIKSNIKFFLLYWKCTGKIRFKNRKKESILPMHKFDSSIELKNEKKSYHRRKHWDLVLLRWIFSHTLMSTVIRCFDILNKGKMIGKTENISLKYSDVTRSVRLMVSFLLIWWCLAFTIFQEIFLFSLTFIICVDNYGGNRNMAKLG